MRPFLTDLAQTAVGVAVYRAKESARPDSLFDDPYAQMFVAAAPDAHASDEANNVLGEAFASNVVIRTRFFDDYLIGAANAGCRQIVLLAAGLDSRAFRLDWPSGVRLFELDLPDILSFKDGVLLNKQAMVRCERTVVPGDLRQDWRTPLTESGFDPNLPTAWLAEGVFIYLTTNEALQLLDIIGKLSAPMSQLAFEHQIADAYLLNEAESTPSVDRFTSLWKSGLSREIPELLRSHGWRVQAHDRGTAATFYGRSIPDYATGGFITCQAPARPLSLD